MEQRISNHRMKKYHGDDCHTSPIQDSISESWNITLVFGKIAVREAADRYSLSRWLVLNSVLPLIRPLVMFGAIYPVSFIHLFAAFQTCTITPRDCLTFATYLKFVSRFFNNRNTGFIPKCRNDTLCVLSVSLLVKIVKLAL